MAFSAGTLTLDEELFDMISGYVQPEERPEALPGPGTLFASAAWIETTWRLVNPSLNRDQLVQEYEGGGWVAPGRSDH